MAEIMSNVSWLAVVVGAILSFILGWAWYSPMLFGEKWAKGSGIELGAADEMPKEAMATQGLGLLAMAWFVNISPVNMAILGTIAFVILGYSGNSFSTKNHYAKFVDAGYWVIALIIMLIVNRFI